MAWPVFHHLCSPNVDYQSFHWCQQHHFSCAVGGLHVTENWTHGMQHLQFSADLTSRWLLTCRLPECSSSLPSCWVVWDSAWCGWEQAHKFCAHERKKSKVNFVSGILFIIAAVLVLMPLRLTTYAIFSHFYRPFQANSQTWYLSWMHFEETRNPSQSKCMYVNLCYSLYFIFTKESLLLAYLHKL